MLNGVIKRMVMGLSVAVLGVMTLNAYSADYNEYVRHVADVEYNIEAIYEDSSNRYIITAASEDEIKPVLQNVDTAANGLRDAFNELYGSLYGGIHDAAEDAYGDLTDFHLDMGDFPKELSLELIGRSNGTIKAKLGPFQFDLDAKAESNYGINIWSANVVADTSSFYVVGDYDIYSGNMTNMRLENFGMYLDLSASSGLAKLAGLNGIIEDAVDDMEAEIKTSLPRQLNALSSAQYKLFDIGEALPTNKYVVAAGIDLAQEVKDLLSRNVDGQRLKISFSRHFVRYSSNRFVSPDSGSDSYFAAHELELEIGSHVRITMWNIPHYGLTRATECNWGECFAPVPTADSPDTNEGYFDLEMISLEPTSPPPASTPSGSACSWSSTPSYGNGMGGVTYYEYPPIGPCEDSVKKVTNNNGSITIEYD
ncbi:hypothetical protein [Marinimicrobium locisalis]|uniref:hypothetical protein n=1 Tax=Marinimicrobium locisalis TaxID=546022 RepID=UPI003221CA7D